MLKIILVITAALIIGIVSFVSTAYAKEKIIACGHPDYPPFMWKEGEKTVGAGVEIAEIIFRELDIEVISKSIGNWRRCLATVASGKADLIIAAYRTDERVKYAKFTKTPLSEDPMVIFVWKGKEFKFEKWEDLKGKTAGILWGDSYGQEFELFLIENIKLEYVTRRSQNFKKLELGRVDFGPMGLHTGLIQAKKYGYSGKVVTLKTPVISNYLYMAMSNKSKYLPYLPQIELELQKLHANGTIERLIKKYIDYYADMTINDEQ
ncbi:substrate-binding periplasmic protein [Psychromonas ossibalaenae]|uniref:substrate-binding periplasmic protein n=1 Tax=Psychromonas ossibalaenae TaxID=444922 RepID=UPI0003637A41|nr:transporter substrate-binding domain-containing protein [Psychromonas ossibalaenae]